MAADFSKAFDRVRHCLLLDKMSSDIESIFSGFHQSSHLVPLCFIWFVNEIAEIFEYVTSTFFILIYVVFSIASKFRVI
jgi:hypothetical protein